MDKLFCLKKLRLNPFTLDWHCQILNFCIEKGRKLQFEYFDSSEQATWKNAAVFLVTLHGVFRIKLVLKNYIFIKEAQQNETQVSPS